MVELPAVVVLCVELANVETSGFDWKVLDAVGNFVVGVNCAVVLVVVAAAVVVVGAAVVVVVRLSGFFVVGAVIFNDAGDVNVVSAQKERIFFCYPNN